MEKMLSLNGIYDGEKIRPLEKIASKKKYKVIITFVEEINSEGDDEGIRSFASQTSAMDFWNDSREDLYQDYLPKTKK